MGQHTANDSMHLKTATNAAHKTASFMMWLLGNCMHVKPLQGGLHAQFSEDTCWSFRSQGDLQWPVLSGANHRNARADSSKEPGLHPHFSSSASHSFSYYEKEQKDVDIDGCRLSCIIQQYLPEQKSTMHGSHLGDVHWSIAVQPPAAISRTWQSVTKPS